MEGGFCQCCRCSVQKGSVHCLAPSIFTQQIVQPSTIILRVLLIISIDPENNEKLEGMRSQDGPVRKSQ